MDNKNFDKYLKISNLSLIIRKVGSDINLIKDYEIYHSLEGCFRSSNIDSILDERKDFYILDIDYINSILSGYSISNNIEKIKKINQDSKSKIIILSYHPLQKLYYESDFIIEYIANEPNIIKNRYFPIYD